MFPSSHNTDLLNDPHDIYYYIEEIAKEGEDNDRFLHQHIRNIANEIVRRNLVEEKIVRASYEEDSEGRNREGETVLHAAIRAFDFGEYDDETETVERNVVRTLIEKFDQSSADILLQHRQGTLFDGQTPLHLAVAKGELWVVKHILDYLQKTNQTNRLDTLLTRKAVGKIFKGTAMIGELPLSIAALMMNVPMVKLLLKYGAPLDGTTSHGDNVIHCLIRYAYLYPDKTEDVLDMCRFFDKDAWINEMFNVKKISQVPEVTAQKNLRKLRHKIWLMENGQQLDPLRLSADLEQSEIFLFIMMQKAYSYPDVESGLFDMMVYDITEIDAVVFRSAKEELKEDIKDMDQVEESGKIGKMKKLILPKTQKKGRSVLETIVEHPPETAFQFINNDFIKQIIEEKWKSYFYVYYLLPGLFHLIFMSLLTWYALERAHIPDPSRRTSGHDFDKRVGTNGLITAYGIFGGIIGFVYVIVEVVRLVRMKIYGHFQHAFDLKERVWNFPKRPYSNVVYRILFVVYGLCLIIDPICSVSAKYYENYLLMVAIVLGWFLTLFFIRGIRFFSFLSVLLHQVIFGDSFRFAVILVVNFIAFTSGLFIVFQGLELPEDAPKETYENFGRTMLLLFRASQTLADVPVLFGSRQPTLAIVIFLLFLTLTVLLLFSSFIAIISSRAEELTEEGSDEKHWRLQQLSIILFIETTLPQKFCKKAGQPKKRRFYSNKIKQRQEMQRYVIRLRSTKYSERGSTFEKLGEAHDLFKKLQREMEGDLLPQLLGNKEKEEKYGKYLCNKCLTEVIKKKQG